MFCLSLSIWNAVEEQTDIQLIKTGHSCTSYFTARGHLSVLFSETGLNFVVTFLRED